jgi:hypothetical protein
MKHADRDALVETLAGAYRSRDPFGAVRFHPAWFDLDEQGRIDAARAAFEQRRVEAALDPDGLSTTARAVLARIAGAGR